MAGPACLSCGRPIPKRTVDYTFSHNDPDPPRSKADVERRVNGQVISVRYWRAGHVMAAGVWDGESYVDRHFCKVSCAAAFGTRAAAAGVRL